MYDILKSCLTVFQRHACGVRSLVIINGVILIHFDGGPLVYCTLQRNKQGIAPDSSKQRFHKICYQILVGNIRKILYSVCLLFKSKSTNYFACARSFGRRPRSFKSCVSTSCKFVFHCRADNFAFSIDSSSVYDSLNQN